MKTTLLVSLISLFVSTSQVYAKESNAKHHHKRIAYHAATQSLTIKLLDNDHNGEVSLVEFRQATYVNKKVEHMFNRIDLNNDGTISFNELTHYKKHAIYKHHKHNRKPHK